MVVEVNNKIAIYLHLLYIHYLFYIHILRGSYIKFSFTLNKNVGASCNLLGIFEIINIINIINTLFL